MDNNNNMMEYNTDESQKKKERQEKIENIKKKVKGFIGKIKEDREDRQRAKEEEERVRVEEQGEMGAFVPKAPPKKSFLQSVLPNKRNDNYSNKTITNSTITNDSSKKNKLSPQEERRKKQKRSKLIRNIMTIPEIIFIIFLALFLKDKYVEYSNDVHQVLTYSAGNYLYEIHRDNKAIKVVKSYRKDCDVAPCPVDNLSEYDINFGKNQMTALRIFMDFTFKFKSTSKSIGLSDVKTDFGKKCIFGIIHNNDNFLGFNSYSKYNVIDYEQISTFTKRGYKYDTSSGRKILNIAMGEKTSSGYSLVLNSVYKQDDDLYVFVQEQVPEESSNTSSVVTHPLIVIELEEVPKNIFVYNVETGEEYPNLDAPVSPSPAPSMVQNRKLINGIVGDLVGALREELKKD